jgi:hypothetical protein
MAVNTSPASRAAWFAALLSLPAAQRAQAQAQALPVDTAAVVVLRLEDGSILRGRVTSQTADSVIFLSEAVGRVAVARSAVTAITAAENDAKSALATVPTLGGDHAPSVRWSRRLEVGYQYMSEVARDEVGAVIGGSVGVSLERSSPKSSVTVGLQLSYQRQNPNPAASDDQMVNITANRLLSANYRLVAQTIAERNRPQEIDARFTQHVGVGRVLVRTNRVRLFVAPGAAFAHANATEEAELASNGAVTVSGVGGGFYESLSLKISPTIQLSQNLLWTEIAGRRQHASTVTLSGQLSAHLGMNVVYNRRYDSGLVDPIRPTFNKVMIGLQLQR